MTHNVLLLGSGTSVPPLCADLCARGYHLTIASRNLGTAEALVAAGRGHVALQLDIDGSDGSRARLSELVGASDIVVSYTSGRCLPQIAEACLEQGKHLVTSSHCNYFGRTPDERAAWHERLEQRGLLLVTEAGSDPGFGRMLGMRLIDDVRREGGEIVELWYHVAALPTRADINPFGYRFSWAPKKAIFTAISMNDESGNWFRNHETVRVPARRVYLDTELVDVPGVGAFETHPNADSGAHLYRDVYGLESAHTFYHGTMRFFGWGSALQGLLEIGADDTQTRPELEGKTWRELTLRLLGHDAGGGEGDPKALLAARLGLHPSNETLLRYEWLGLFDDQPIESRGPWSFCDLISERMVERLEIFDPDGDEPDQMIFYYDVLARFGDTLRRIRSVTNPRRGPKEFSVCSTLTSLTSAMCVRYALEGELKLRGLQQAVGAEFYTRILAEYEARGVCEVRTTTEA